jgi:hypothetical protein
MQRAGSPKLAIALACALAFGPGAAHSQSLDLTLHPANRPSAPAANPLLPAVSTPATAAPTESSAAADPVAAPQSAWSSPGMLTASAELKGVAQWIAASDDNARMPYLLIDKVGARVFVFDGDGRLRGVAPALLGMSKGDVMTVSNATQMAQMGPNDRITPAGRYVSRLAMDSHGKELLVIDYDAAISLHAVVKGTPKERRAERLDSPTPLDNRISFGCINVPADFYANVVSPSFAGKKGIVYILPETKPANQLFAMQPPAPPATAALSGTAPAPASATSAAPTVANDANSLLSPTQ